MKKTIFLILLIVLVAGAIVFLKKKRQEVADLPTAQDVPCSVRTIMPASASVSATSSFLAKLEASETAEISSRITGRILKVLVSENQMVKKGDMLVQIDEQDILSSILGIRAQLDAAVTQHEYNRTSYDRNLILFRAGGLSKDQLDMSRVALDKADAVVKDLKQKILGFENQLKYSRIRAPFDGITGTVFLYPGAMVLPGRPVLRLHSLSQKLTFAFVPGSGGILSGSQVLSADTKKSFGRIVKIYHEAQKGLSVAEIKPDAPMDSPSGSYHNILVVTRSVTGCTVPVQALLHRPEGTSVMVFKQNIFMETPVQVIVEDGLRAVIEPCVKDPVAVGSEAKLSLLPTCDRVNIVSGGDDE